MYDVWGDSLLPKMVDVSEEAAKQYVVDNIADHPDLYIVDTQSGSEYEYDEVKGTWKEL